MKCGKCPFGAWSNIISNESDYSPSLIDFKVESNRQLSCDGLNMAEISAMNAEREREEKKRREKESFEKNLTQYRKNNSQYRMKKEEGKSLRVIEQLENEKKKLNQMVYNATIRKTNLDKIKERDDRGKSTEQPTNNSRQLKSQKERKAKEIKEGSVMKSKTNEMTEQRIKPVNHEIAINSIKAVEERNITEDSNTITINIRNTIDDIISKRLQTPKSKAIQLILEEKKNAYLEIASNLKQLSSFRENGIFQINQQQSKSSDAIPTKAQVAPQRQNSTSKPDQSHSKHKQSKLDKKRFNFALKKLFIEKLGERNIAVPSICNCGQLQKHLDTILYVKNNSVHSVFKPTCANNCLYYNKRNEYEKSIQDILASIRNLKFDSFNNKY